MLWGVLVANAFVASLKAALGVTIGSIALVADAIHSAIDASSNVVGLIGMTFAAKPPDREHPYGHRRFETIASLVIGVLMVAGIIEILQRAFTAEHEPEASWPVVAVVAGTIVFNVFISRYEHSRGHALHSSILAADSAHTMSDAFAALVVLAALVGSLMGWSGLDRIAALVVCAIIAWTGVRIIRSNLQALVDASALPREAIEDVAREVSRVRAVRAVRSRRSGDAVHVDLSIIVDGEVPLREAHDTSHDVMDAIRRAFPEVDDVVVHIEPDER